MRSQPSPPPAAPDPLFDEALRLHQAGQLEAAAVRYRELLAREPRHAAALHYLGLLCHQGRQHDEAVRLISESLAVEPGNPSAYSNLGNVLAALGRLDEAETAFRSALSAAPRFADAAFNLGNILRQRQKLDAAEAAYREAIGANPDHVAALNNLAMIARLQGRPQDAAAALLHLGDVLQTHGRVQDAANAYLQAQAIAPDPGIEVKLALLMPVIAASAADIDVSRRRIADAVAALKARGVRLPHPLRYASSALFYLAYQGRNDRELRSAIADFYVGACPGLAWRAPHCAGYSGPGARMRIGFVSKFLHPDHPIGKYYGSIIGRLDRARFDVFAFRFAGTPGPESMPGTELATLADDLDAAREAVAGARLDALLYPDVGMEPTTYFLAMSRLAPVQAVSLGHPVTSGIANLDYFLSSVELEPAGSESHYSETLVRLAHVPAYFRADVRIGAAPPRAALGLPADATLYACGQSPIKIHPEFDPVLAQVLRRDPSGLLVLFESDRTPVWTQLLRQRFARTIPDVAARIVFLPFMDLAAFLGFMAGADAVLDTPFFAGGTTSLEMFAADIPIVTWPGPDARSRQTHALYAAMQLTGLTANGAAEFVDIALRLAHDAPWRESLRGELRRRRHVLYENQGAVAELEAFLAAAVAAAAQGRKLARWPG